MSYELASAVSQGMRILHWQENLPEEEMPPVWMWHLDHELTDWFEIVDANRREKYGIADKDEVVPLAQNELSMGNR